MSTLFLTLGVIVVIAVVVFLFSLFKVSIEDADFWLKGIAGLLLVFTMLTGIAALITSQLINNAQDEKNRIHEKALEEGRTKQAEEEAKVLALRQNQPPRRLTPDQKATLSRELPPGGDPQLVLKIVCRDSADDKEVTAYAMDFIEAFKEKGWKVEWLNVGLPYKGPITLRYTRSVPLGVPDKISRAFDSAGLRFQEQLIDSNVVPPLVQLEIPVRP